MRIETEVEVSANAAERWRSQYKDWLDDDRFSDGTTKGEKNDELNQRRHTPEAIKEILNDGWAMPECECCEQRKPAVAVFATTWRDEAVRICADCARKAVAAFDCMGG